MFTVYQVPTSNYYDAKTNQLTGGFYPNRALINNGCVNDKVEIWKNIDAYKPVAVFAVDDLDAVFEASNSPYNREHFESVTTRLAEMHSVSVGDLVKDSEDKVWLCYNHGWQELYAHKGRLNG